MFDSYSAGITPLVLIGLVVLWFLGQFVLGGFVWLYNWLIHVSGDCARHCEWCAKKRRNGNA